MFSSSYISPASDADLGELVSLINSAYRGEIAKNGWTHEADLLHGPLRINEEALANLLERDNNIILKYSDENGGITGCVYLEEQGRKLYLGMLTVSPFMQAKGIGKQLLKAAVEYAKQKNADTIVMTVISARHELIAWYERQGYKTTGEKKPFPAEPEFGMPVQPLEFIVLEKKIG
jgi:ribosomal protein S18 acetylase RimI-like enzyme